MPSFMKGWYDRSTVSIGNAEIFVPVINAEISENTLTNLLMCSSNLSDEQYLSFLLYGSYHFIVAPRLVEPCEW